MQTYQLQSKTDILYTLFSNQVYKPSAYWNTERGFKLDPLYQHKVNEFIQTPTQPVAEFVLDTTLVPPPGIEPGSSDFQSAA